MRRKNHRTALPALDEVAAAAVFLEVVKAGGFTGAARSLGKSTSSLSRTLVALERRLGAQLLARTTRRVRLTEAGALYATHAEALLGVQRAAHEAIAELTGGVPRGRLRVSMPVSVGERLMGPVVSELRRRHPQLKLEIDLSDRRVRLVEEGFDLAVRVGRMADSSHRAQLLARVPVRLVASPGYVARRSAPKAPADLAQHDCITLGAVPGPQEWSFYPRRGRGHPQHVAVEGAVLTSSASFGAQLAGAGLGVLRVVEWSIRDELRRGELVELLPEWSCDDPARGGIPIWAVYAQTAGVLIPPKSRLFVELVKAVVVREGLAAPASTA